ncbi:MAG: PHP domain-containing protein [Clostridia bacterium]|nr:PHP domain-containing protein [Clostridia bacterium]
MRADLHVHSVYSDGSYTPEALAALAKGKGVELISVTDHDNFAGDVRKRKAFESVGIRYVTGVEISAYENKTKVHVTGYGYDATSPLCLAYQKERIALADERLFDVLNRLKKYKNISLSEQSVRAELKEENIPVHTMHVVLALLKAGYFSSVKEAFHECFMPHLPTYSYVGRPTPAQAIEMIHSLGGVACVAHPGRISLPFEEREKLLFSLKELGIDGIECVYSTHTQEQTEYFKGLTEKWNLLKTGGSDFHNDFGKRVIGLPLFEPDQRLLEAVHVREERGKR